MDKVIEWHNVLRPTENEQNIFPLKLYLNHMIQTHSSKSKLMFGKTLRKFSSIFLSFFLQCIKINLHTSA